MVICVLALTIALVGVLGYVLALVLFPYGIEILGFIVLSCVVLYTLIIRQRWLRCLPAAVCAVIALGLLADEPTRWNIYVSALLLWKLIALAALVPKQHWPKIKQGLVAVPLVFPSSFLWGASTSSHQIEGGQKNNWTVWEARNADRLAATAADRYSDLPFWKDNAATMSDPATYQSGKAAESFERYEEDLGILEELGMNAYRMSVEWSRLEPVQGQWDMQAFDHYRRVLSAARQRGITPVVTLWHWTTPLWFAEQGDWANPEAPAHFRAFAEKVATELGSEIDMWVTVNEPGVYAAQAYLAGYWPPARRNPLSYLKVIRNLVTGSNMAARAVHENDPESQVGVAQHVIVYTPLRWTPWDVGFSAAMRYIAHDFFLRATIATTDYVGVNFYGEKSVQNMRLVSRSDARRSDLGWELSPEGLGKAIASVRRYGQPIYVTEHGLADAADQNRAWYIRESLKGIAAQVKDGADVRGYLHWSLLDNFEWAEGSWPRFGLVEVDYATGKRSIRPSAYEYAAMKRQEW
jgi:beta-glucosidase